MSVDRFYQYILYAVLAFAPFAFFFNTEIFHALNCSPANTRLNWFFLLMTSLADGLWVIMIATVAHSLRPRNFAVLVLALVIGVAFWWSAENGQFDDLDGPGQRILMDEDRPPDED